MRTRPTAVIWIAFAAGVASAAVSIDPWSLLERHPASVNAITETTRPDLISLRGDWQFVFKNALNGSFGDYTNRYLWLRYGERKIHVPGCWEAQGVGEPGLSRPWAVSWDQSPQPLRHVATGVGWYRKEIPVPATWRGKRIWLKIGGVASVGTFTVNRHSVARLNPYCGSWKYDITAYVRPGETNELFAEIANFVPSRRGQVSSTHHFGGFWRDVELEATPQTLIDDAWVRVDCAKREAEVHVALVGKDAAVGRIRVTVEGECGEGAATEGEHVLRIPLRNYREWSPEHPNLYTACVELVSSKGDVRMVRCERFGARSFERRGDRLFLNGNPFFVRGAGYHHIYPITGIAPADDRGELRRRVRKIRAAGFNFVRLHTHCEIPEFFEICDEEGLMVEPELPYYHSIHADGLAFDPMGDARELWENFRRYPSFAQYSFGNEGDFDEACTRRMFEGVHKMDPDRLIVSQDGTRDFLSAAYTDFADGPRNPWPRGAFRSSLPTVAHEYMNLCVKLDYRIAGKYAGVHAPVITSGDRAAFLKPFKIGMARGAKLQDAQNALQKFWFKYGIELARADPYCSGYSYWSLLDAGCPQRGTYSGQALFDPFMDDKRGGWTTEGVATFNGPTTLLLDTETGPRLFAADPREPCGRYATWIEGTNRIYRSDQTIPAKILLAHYGDEPLVNAVLRWELVTEGQVVSAGDTCVGKQELGPARQICDLSLKAPDVSRAQRFELRVKIADKSKTIAANAWPLYVFPRMVRQRIRSHPNIAAETDIARRLKGRHVFRGDLETAATVLVARDSVAYWRALTEERQNIIEIAGQDGPADITLGWWWMGSQIGTVFETEHPLLADLPKEPFLASLHTRILKKGARLPLDGFTEDDLVVYGEGVDACQVYLAKRRLPWGKWHVFVCGLDILSDLPESRAILDRILSP